MNRDSSFCESKKKQKLLKDLCEAPENSPASWCKKSESKGAVVPPADFLLEAEKRGSPPKSEKAAAFWRVGGAGRGVQPFLRKESSEISGEGDAESRILRIMLQYAFLDSMLF